MKVCPKYRIPQNLDADFTEAAPGEFRVFIESNLREAVPMWTLCKNRELHRHPDGSNTQLAIALKELNGTILISTQRAVKALLTHLLLAEPDPANQF